MLAVVGAHHGSRAQVVFPKSGERPSALDALLRSGAIGEREHAAGLAYGRLRARWERVEHLGERWVAPTLDRIVSDLMA